MDTNSNTDSDVDTRHDICEKITMQTWQGYEKNINISKFVYHNIFNNFTEISKMRTLEIYCSCLFVSLKWARLAISHAYVSLSHPLQKKNRLKKYTFRIKFIFSQVKFISIRKH